MLAICWSRMGLITVTLTSSRMSAENKWFVCGYDASGGGCQCQASLSDTAYIYWKCSTCSWWGEILENTVDKSILSGAPQSWSHSTSSTVIFSSTSSLISLSFIHLFFLYRLTWSIGNCFVLHFYDLAGNRSELGGSKVENISWSSVDLRRMQGVSFSLSHERKWITFCYKQRAKNLIQQLSIPSLAYYRISQYLALVILLLRVHFVHQKSHFCTVVTWVNLVVLSYRLHTMASSVLLFVSVITCVRDTLQAQWTCDKVCNVLSDFNLDVQIFSCFGFAGMLGYFYSRSTCTQYAGIYQCLPHSK